MGMRSVGTDWLARGGTGAVPHPSRAVAIVIAGLVIAGLVMAAPAFAAESLYDGPYTGPGKVTYGTAPVCGSDAETTVTVKDSQIQYPFGAFPLKMKIAPDGTFTGRTRKGNRGGGQVVHVKGHIANSMLDADLRVNGVNGRVCSYHWSLKKT